MRHLAIYLLLIGLLALPAAAFAYNNTSLEWRTLKTEHFEVHYHQGAEWTAQMVAKVAEEAHGPLTALYQYEPPTPVHFIIKDTNDYANGAAYFYDNKVEIWATNLEFGLRGTTSWIRNVVTHEYCHIISIQASLKFPRRVPAIYFQAIGFEEEKRPDVLQGYPNLIASYPISGVMMPPWFAEGVAQYQAPDDQWDCWDAHRDMILRCGSLDDAMLSYNEMCFFGKNGLGSEQVYDHGYGLVRYIAETYGPDAVRKAAEGLKTVYRLNMDGALKHATGKKGVELYNDWKASLKARYDAEVAEFDLGNRAGTLLRDDGFMTIGPVFSPNGRRIAFLSNRGSDYASTSLYIMNRDGRDVRMLEGHVSSVPDFSPDGRKLLYSRTNKVDRYGATVNDLFIYDIESKEEKRLTRSARAADADLSPDGKLIACVTNHDGTHRLVVMDNEGLNRRELFSGPMGTQIYNPRFSKDGSRVLFGIFEGVTRDIAIINVDGTGFDYVLKTGNDERDAAWTPDGAGIVFSSDRTGIFNVYEMDLATGDVIQHTNAVGGAFMPHIAPDGTSLVYAGYGSGGYSIYKIDGLDTPTATMPQSVYAERAAGRFDDCVKLRAAEAGVAGQAAAYASQTIPAGSPSSAGAVATQGDTPGTAALDTGGSGADAMADDVPGGRLPSEKYKGAYTPFQIYPRVLIWDGTFRFGFLTTSYEILDKQSLLFAGSYGTNGEYDAYLNYEIRHLFPTLFVDGLLIREKTKDYGILDNAQPPFRYDFDIRYDAWIVDLGMSFEFGPQYSLTSQNNVSAYWSHSEYKVNFDVRQYEPTGEFRTSDDAGWKYYIGNQLHLDWTIRSLAREVTTDINPTGGRQIQLHYMRSFDKLFEDDSDFAYGFRPEFTNNYYNQYTVDWLEFVGLPWWGHSLRLRGHASLIDEGVDDFFWIYLGGMDGIRGYTYYSVAGRKGLIGSITYRFPILRSINRQFLHLYFRDIYGGVFAETANAWEGDIKLSGGFKDSAGYELRMNLGSFYIFPTTISFTGAYAFDPVQFEGAPIGGIPTVIRQDEGWSYYFQMGFGFSL